MELAAFIHEPKGHFPMRLIRRPFISVLRPNEMIFKPLSFFLLTRTTGSL